MEQNNSSANSISLIDLFAFCLSKIHVLFVGALIGISLLISFQYLSSNSEGKKKEFEASVIKYNNELENAENTYTNLNNQLEELNNQLNANPIFSAENVYCASIMISFKAEGSTVTPVAVNNNNENSQLSPIEFEITQFWNNLNISSVLGLETENDLLKSSMTLQINGTSLVLKIYADSPDVSLACSIPLSEQFLSFINNHDNYSVTYHDTLVFQVSRNEINEIMKKYNTEKTAILLELSDIDNNIKSLRKSEPSRINLTKTVILGSIIGIGVTFIIIMFVFGLRNPVNCSFNIEKNCSIPFLGSIFINCSPVAKASRCLIGERRYKNKGRRCRFEKGILLHEKKSWIGDFIWIKRH